MESRLRGPGKSPLNMTKIFEIFACQAIDEIRTQPTPHHRHHPQNNISLIESLNSNYSYIYLIRSIIQT